MLLSGVLIFYWSLSFRPSFHISNKRVVEVLCTEKLRLEAFVRLFDGNVVRFDSKFNTFDWRSRLGTSWIFIYSAFNICTRDWIVIAEPVNLLVSIDPNMHHFNVDPLPLIKLQKMLKGLDPRKNPKLSPPPP